MDDELYPHFEEGQAANWNRETPEWRKNLLGLTAYIEQMGEGPFTVVRVRTNTGMNLFHSPETVTIQNKDRKERDVYCQFLKHAA